MSRLFKNRRLLASAIVVGLAIHLASCGTLLHPERRGQPAGPLDPGIVILDAIGLIFFFVPGVIAFAVDFTTGAIYLPSEPSGVLVPYYVPPAPPPEPVPVPQR